MALREKKTAPILILLCVGLCFLMSACDGSSTKYGEALSFMEDGDYQAAIDIFTSIPDYEDSNDKAIECRYMLGIGAMNDEDWAEAIDRFSGLDYKDSDNLLAMYQGTRDAREC